jgi:outer membrane protein OmpA-like peptidoglycan-associated protein
MERGRATMNNHWTLVGLAAAAGLTLSGCVTIESFDKHMEEINARHDALAARVDTLDGRVNSVSQATQAAQGKADAAYKLAEGKFLMTEVGRESINFEFGKATLSDEAKATLTSLAERLKSENKNVYVEVRGHTDAVGGKGANRQLGRERAQNTARFLADQGVPGNKLQIGSWGEDQTKPGDNDAANRRVDIVIVA